MSDKVTQYYECHITMVGNLEQCKIAVQDIGWKFSAIDGDPVLGEGVKCYATKHFNAKLSEKVVLEILNNAYNELNFYRTASRNYRPYELIRKKIEKVLYDDRSSKVRLGKCNGACPGCHLDDYEESGLTIS